MEDCGKYHVYLLRCEGGELYAGITTDLERRFAEHAAGGPKGAKYTRAHPPVRFEATWAASDRAAASALEYRLKRLTHAQKEAVAHDPDAAADLLGDWLAKYNGGACSRDGGGTMLFVQYPKCSTCKKAKAWLDDHNIEYDERHIVEDNPTADELRMWHRSSDLPLRRFFNTSGMLYREMQLKDKLPAMSEDEMYELLATDGMLVKRPLLVLDDTVLVGFKQSEWEQVLG